MREIKFRAWDKKKKKFIDPKQISYEECEWGFWDEDEHIIEEGFELMQFIGLKDKNGKDIYEGDVVDIIHPCWTNKAVVEFKNGSFIFKSTENDNRDSIIPGYTFMKEIWEIEVIGNIYKDKDLI